QPKQPDFNISNKNDFPKVEVVFDMEDICINEPLLLDNSFSELCRLLTNMNNEMLLNNLANNDYWNYAIDQKLLDGNYAINWNSLLSNYKKITHLYREALYYRKMIEQVPNDPQMDFEYTERLQDTDELLPFVSRDTIVKTLNKVKKTFNLMYHAFRSATDLPRAKELYILWNTNIDRTYTDDNFFQYKTKTSQYLAMLFAEWIKYNVESGTNNDLLNDISESIISSRCQREDDTRIKRSREVIQPQIVVLPKLYTWNQKTDKYEVILKKNSDLTKLYPSRIYVQKFNSKSSTPIYEP
ncbi:22313_t:CDS:2, partial [Cetraspora pellucida]